MKYAVQRRGVQDCFVLRAGGKYATTTGGGFLATMGGGLEIETKPVGITRRGYRNNRPRVNDQRARFSQRRN